MTPLDWVALAVIVGGVVFLRRRIAALVRRATVAARKRPVFWIGPLVLVGLFFAWKGPDWQLASRQGLLTPGEYLELQNSYRATIVQALGGLFLLLGIYFTWRRVTATERQVEIAGERQITERFTRAIEQLGSDKLEVRLGGIYALERIARDSERDHWTIMEVLTAYVRAKSAWTAEKESQDGDPPPLPPYIQAILIVIGRRRVEFESNIVWRLDLSGSDLREAQLIDAHLDEANLWGAHLEGANLWGARLEDAVLTEANLSTAYLREAELARADLRGLDLSEAKGLTREQIESAITDENTIWPDYLKEGGEESAEEAGGEGES